MRDLDYRREVVWRWWRQRGIRNLESWKAGGRTLFFRIYKLLEAAQWTGFAGDENGAFGESSLPTGFAAKGRHTWARRPRGDFLWNRRGVRSSHVGYDCAADAIGFRSGSRRVP